MSAYRRSTTLRAALDLNISAPKLKISILLYLTYRHTNFFTLHPAISREHDTENKRLQYRMTMPKNKQPFLISNVLFIASEFGKGSYRNDFVIQSKYAIILSD